MNLFLCICARGLHQRGVHCTVFTDVILTLSKMVYKILHVHVHVRSYLVCCNDVVLAYNIPRLSFLSVFFFVLVGVAEPQKKGII